jgi:hypothetical protein
VGQDGANPSSCWLDGEAWALGSPHWHLSGRGHRFCPCTVGAVASVPLVKVLVLYYTPSGDGCVPHVACPLDTGVGLVLCVVFWNTAVTLSVAVMQAARFPSSHEREQAGASYVLGCVSIDISQLSLSLDYVGQKQKSGHPHCVAQGS